MWQSLVTIGQAIRRLGGAKKEEINGSGKTEWPVAGIEF